MKLIAQCRWVALVLLVLTLAQPSPTRADNTHAYSQGNSPQTSHQAWMKWVPDSKPLNLLAIPGTHDTMSRFGGTLAETQQLNLFELLNSGIRALDIRAKLRDDAFKIYHGIMNQNASFDAVLSFCNIFLESNPSEVIIMRVADEDYEDSSAWKAKLEEYRNGPLGTRIWKKTGSNPALPTLGEVRGKIVIRDDLEWTVNDSTLYNVQWAWNISYRWDDTKLFFEYMDGDVTSYPAKETPHDDDYATYRNPANDSVFYINSLSGTSENGGVHPYHVASYTNPRALQYLFGRNQHRFTGILQADFPGGSLISAIIAHNLKHVTNATARSTFKESLQTIWTDSIYALKDADFSRYSITDQAEELKKWLGHILPGRGPSLRVRDYWSVIVKQGDTGFDNWAVVSGESTGQSLLVQSEWIDDKSYVAVNALSQATSVTEGELQAFLLQGAALKSQHLTVLNAAGDCRDRARALRSLVRTQFPSVRWNTAVSRGVPLGIALNSTAFVIASAVSSDKPYFYYVWAGSENESAPIPRIGGPYIASSGQTVRLDASATTVPDSNPILTYRWDFDNDGTWDATTSSATVDHVFRDSGQRIVRVQITYGDTTVETNANVTVNNQAPLLNLGSPSSSIVAGNSFSRSCFFLDPGNDTWTVTANYGDGTPVKTISHINKAFILSHTYTAPGTYAVNVTVNDGISSSQGTIALTVAAAGPPIVQSFTGPTGPVPEGSPVTVSGSFYYGVWVQTLRISWGDGTPDTQPVVLAAGGGNYTFTAQHTYANQPPGGSSEYTVTATWPTWTTLTLPITVVDVPSTFSSLTFPATVPEGTPVQVGYTINAPTQDVLTKQVDWGDGTSQGWVGGPLSATSPSHTYTTAGTYLMTLRVTDDDNSSDIQTRTITVTDAAPTLLDFVRTTPEIVEGGAANVLGHFQSANLANERFTVEIDWGDGLPVTAAPYRVVGLNTAEFNASHVYRDNLGLNPWIATVKITDDDGSVVTGSAAIPVLNAPPIVVAVANFDVPLRGEFSKPCHITDPGSDTFTGTVSYGDGTGTVPLNVVGNSYELSHVYQQAGVYSITVTVTDDDGASASRKMDVLVGPVQSLLVTNTNDSGPGSLRQAVLDANTPSLKGRAFPSAYTEIRFSSELTLRTIVLTSGQLTSSLRTKFLAENFPDGITISGNNASRILEVAPNSVVELNSIHLTDGFAPLGGGAVLVGSEAGLTLNRCSISNSATTELGGGIQFVKGASLRLNQCTVSGCKARDGGGIHFYGLGGKELRVENSTFSGNSAFGNTKSSGGAIYNLSGRLIVNHCTISSNTVSGTASKGGGIHSSDDALLELNNSIVASNFGASLANVSGLITGSGNLTSGDPMLLPLGNYGGPTATMPPGFGSPAIDAVSHVDIPIYLTEAALWRMGEGEDSAANGLTTTSISNRFGSPLTFNLPVTYTNGISSIAAGWLESRLAVSLPMGSYGTRELVGDFLGNTNITDNFGIEVWVKPDDVTGVKCVAYNGDSRNSGWGLYQIDSTFSGLFGGVIILGSGSAVPGAWTHLALVRDAGTATLYVNGVPSGTTTANPNVPSGRFAVGAQAQSLSAEFFAGALDELHVFTFAPGQFSPDLLSYQPKLTGGRSYLPGSGGASAHSVTWSQDQRGAARVSGKKADIGAVELAQEVVRLKDNDGHGSLRQTIRDVLEPGVITFAQSLAGQTIALTSGRLSLDKSIVLDASELSNGVVVSGTGSTRVMEISANNTVVLNALTITRGFMASGGGGLWNGGNLTLNECSISENVAIGPGGGIYNLGGTATLNRCTVNGNRAEGLGGGLSSPIGEVILNQCTFSGNRASTSGGAISFGANGGTVRLNHCTLSGNTSQERGGGITHSSGSLFVFNSIIAGNTQGLGEEINGTGTYTGSNLTSGTPLLAPLGDYGGRTQSMPPLPGSPAIDAGAPNAFTLDQRGALRLNGPATDIGSVEAFPFSTLPRVDTDGDGVDDRWELGYFGNLTTVTSSSDTDGDGSSDASELANMTHPQDPDDSLRISSFAPAAGFDAISNPIFDVTVRTFPGLSYTLQTSPTLGTFTDVPAGSFIAPNRSYIIQVRLTPGQDFLRIRRD